MIEQIYDTDKLLNEMYGGYTVCIRLSKQKIEDWKNSGKFAYIKKELMNLPKLKFSCTILDNGECKYYFIVHNEKLRNRIHTMLETLSNEDRKIALVKCKGVDQFDGTSPYVDGSMQLCPLF